MQLKKGRFTVGNEVYRKKIEVPTVHKIMDLTDESIKDTKEITIAESDTYTEQGSRFTAYATHATSLEQVRNQYTHMRCKHSTATHVSMAYRLTGLNKAYDEDCLDDGEHSMGRRVLNQMIEADKNDISVFVVRHYGGRHIGPKRFTIAKDCVTQALQRLSDKVMVKQTLPLRCLLNSGNTNWRRKARTRKSPQGMRDTQRGLQHRNRNFVTQSESTQWSGQHSDSVSMSCSARGGDTAAFNTCRDSYYTTSPPKERWSNISTPAELTQDKLCIELNGSSAGNLCSVQNAYSVVNEPT